jgi:hypothetical protein
MSERHSRQSFLGHNSEHIISSCIVGVVGLGGGGSHIVQQLAHVGVRNYVLYDPDKLEESNLNRTVIGNIDDVVKQKSKLELAAQVIRRLNPEANITTVPTRWQDNPLPLRECDIIVGCIDGFDERRQLEASARRYLIPYIDIGLDVNHVEPEPPRMSGQVILSLPGGPCLACTGFLNEQNLAKEATNYGTAGIRPQVVWANGVIASAAVGIVVDIITGWTKTSPKVIYLQYDGNSSTLMPHKRTEYMDLSANCPHYPIKNVGDPMFKKI